MHKLLLFAALCLVVDGGVAYGATPPPPTNVHVTAQTATSISIAWSGTVKRYAVWLENRAVTRVNAKSFTYSGLVCGTTYTLGVRSVSGSSVSALVTISGSTSACSQLGSDPPPQSGYFPNLTPVGGWSGLPTGASCASQVHRSTWEPRPDNTKRNHVLVNATAVHDAFAARPRGSEYDSRWDSWLLQRVDGQFSGTTDEIFQWAACKWGLPDNLLRAIAVRESTWYQYLTYPDGTPVPNYGSGDIMPSGTAGASVYCDYINTFGYNYGSPICPRTFSITGIMSWESPAWTAPAPPYAGNQNGTFPFNRNSTAFAEDYIGSYLRGCYEGWIHWLGPSGDIWGCVGSWYAGDWHSSAADGYIGRVQNEWNTYRWLQPSWPTDKPPCSTSYGCPGPDPLP